MLVVRHPTLAVLCLAVVLTGCGRDSTDSADGGSTAGGTNLRTATEPTPTESTPAESPPTEPSVIRTARDAEAVLGTTMGLLEPHCEAAIDFYCEFADSAGNAYAACLYSGKVADIVGYNWQFADAATGSDLCLEGGLGEPMARPAPLRVKAKRLIEADLADANAMVDKFECRETSDRVVACLVKAHMPTQSGSDFALEIEVVCDTAVANARCEVRS